MTDDSYSLLPPPPPPPPRKERTRARDALCKSCGYNLRGIPLSRPCPECGTPFVDRYCNDELQYANPHWVQKLAWGAVFLSIGSTATIVLGLVLLVLAIFSAYSGTELFTVSYTAISGIELVGFLLLTAKEPAADVTERLLSLRRLLRFFAPVTLLAVISLLWDGLGPLLSILVPHSILNQLPLWALAFVIAQIMLMAFHFYYLINRVPDLTMAMHYLGCAWFICGWVTGTFLIAFFSTELIWIWGIFTFLPGACVLFLRWVLLLSCATTLHACAKEAERYSTYK